MNSQTLLVAVIALESAAVAGVLIGLYTLIRGDFSDEHVLPPGQGVPARKAQTRGLSPHTPTPTGTAPKVVLTKPAAPTPALRSTGNHPQASDKLEG